MASGHDDVFHHVRDFTYFEIPRFLTPDGSGHLHIPQPFGKLFTITKFMVIEVIVLVLALLAVIPVAPLLAAFPTSLLIPLLLMAVATALFYVWA